MRIYCFQDFPYLYFTPNGNNGIKYELIESFFLRHCLAAEFHEKSSCAIVFLVVKYTRCMIVYDYPKCILQKELGENENI